MMRLEEKKVVSISLHKNCKQCSKLEGVHLPQKKTFFDPCPVSWQVRARGFDDLWKKLDREPWPQHRGGSSMKQQQ